MRTILTGRVEGCFPGRKRKDQPSMARIRRPETEVGAEEGSVRFRILAVNDDVSARDHLLLLHSACPTKKSTGLPGKNRRDANNAKDRPVQTEGRAEARPYSVVLTRCHLLFLVSQQLPRTDHALNLAGALINGDHPRVPLHPLPIFLSRIPHVPVRLHCLIPHTLNHLPSPHLALAAPSATFLPLT